MNEALHCWKWSFTNDHLDRYFYGEDSENEVRRRIERTYRCEKKDYQIISLQYRDVKSNKLIYEVMQ